MDAPEDERPSTDGAVRPSSESLPTLLDVLSALSKAMGAQTELMAMLATQNQALIELLTQDDDEPAEDMPRLDLAGRPLL